MHGAPFIQGATGWQLLTYNPDDRLSARQALRHAYLKELRDQEKKAKREAMARSDGVAANTMVAPSTASSTMSSQVAHTIPPARAVGRPSLVDNDEGSSLALPTIKPQHNSDHGGDLPAVGAAHAGLPAATGAHAPGANSKAGLHIGLPELSFGTAAKGSVT